MKVLAVLLLSGVVLGHGGGGSDWDTYKQWTAMKAMEGCWGEENVKIHTVNIKKAVAKCYQQDAPELNLPPFRSPYRFINTLVSSANEMEQKQVMYLYRMMQQMKEFQSIGDMYNPYGDQKYSFKPYSVEVDDKSIAEKMMKIMFEMNTKNKYDSFKPSYNSEVDELDFKGWEAKMKENMMLYKLQQRQRSNDESNYNPFANKNAYLERMATLLQRQKRDAADLVKPAGVVGGAVTLPESLDLGDRLADKLKAEQKKMEAKIGNMTCVMREMGVLNQQNEIDFTVQKQYVEKFNMPSPWFKNRILNDMQVCVKTADALPAEAQKDLNFPGFVNLAKVKAYMSCCKVAKLKTCMFQDVKNKLETNFGTMEQILEQTQLTEDQLFPLVIQLLHGDEMEYYSF